MKKVFISVAKLLLILKVKEELGFMDSLQEKVEALKEDATEEQELELTSEEGKDLIDAFNDAATDPAFTEEEQNALSEWKAELEEIFAEETVETVETVEETPVVEPVAEETEAENNEEKKEEDDAPVI